MVENESSKKSHSLPFFFFSQLAAFLKEIAGSRHAVLSQLKKDLGGDSQDPPLQSQGPMGRFSLDRQDFE